MTIILNKWKVVMGGRRQGANITVSDGKREVSGTTIDWLDNKAQPCQRKKAAFIKIRKWSYSLSTQGIPQVFAVPVPEAPGPDRESGIVG